MTLLTLPSVHRQDRIRTTDVKGFASRTQRDPGHRLSFRKDVAIISGWLRPEVHSLVTMSWDWEARNLDE